MSSVVGGIDFSAPRTTVEVSFLIFSYSFLILYAFSFYRMEIIRPETLRALSYFRELATGCLVVWLFRPSWLPLIGRTLPLTRLQYEIAFSAGAFLVIGLIGDASANWKIISEQTKAEKLREIKEN